MRNRVWVSVLAVAALLTVTGVRGQGPGEPILVVVNSTAPNPFGNYVPEILRAEGIPAFSTVALSAVDADALAAARVVILTDTPLDAAQAALFRAHVQGGGRLIAMRPDPQLADLLGVTAVGSGPTDSSLYMALNPAAPAAAGLSTVTLPVRDDLPAAFYQPAPEAQVVATLYSDRTTPTPYPAVVRFGTTATWAFDLARAVAYARQGHPENADVNTGGPVLQSFDIFNTRFDVERMAVPYADVQMKLFARLVDDLLAETLPLPRLWHFPDARRALVLLTSDAHTTNPADPEALFTLAESYGGRVSMYMSRFLGYSGAQMDDWRARGHELGLHPVPFDDNQTLTEAYQTGVDYYTVAGWGTPSRTARSHRLEWQGWADGAAIASNFGVGLDLNPYSFGPMVTLPGGLQGQGYITGSGLPMRFVTQTGAVLPVYGQVDVLIDHKLFGFTIWSDNFTGAQALALSQSILDDARTQYHTVVPMVFNTDWIGDGNVQTWANGTLAYAQANDIPLWTAERWLEYTEARAATTLTGLAWSPTTRQLQFTATVPAGAEAQTLTLPAAYAGGALLEVRVNGAVVPVTAQTINGRALAMFAVPAGAAPVVATYAVSLASVGSVSVGEAAGTVVVPITLSAPATHPVTVDFATSDGSAVTPGDYTTTTGSVTFQVGETAQSATVVIVDDVLDELDETFMITLSAPVNALLGTATAAVTIQDDDPPPAMSVTDGAVAEGDVSGAEVVFDVTLSAVSGRTVTVSYATADGTAIGGTDYVATSGILTFAPGVTSQSIAVAIIADNLDEPDETFTLSLSAASGATIVAATATGTILDDDVVPTGVSDAYSTPFETTLTVNAPGVLANDGNTTGGAMTATLVSTTSNGTLTLSADGGVTYTPNRGFAGADGFTYRPNNADGAGAVTSVDITVDAPTTVQPPEALRVAILTPGTVILRWNAPTLGPRPTGYLVDAGLLSGQTVASFATPAGMPLLIAATPPRSYYVRVRSVGTGGPSDVSNEIHLNVGVTAPPSVPEPLLATPTGSNVHLAWRQTFEGGAPTGMVLDVTGPVTASLPVGSGEQFSFAGVPAGTYTLSLRATNGGGSSAATTPQVLTVPGSCAGPPEPPTNLGVHAAGRSAIAVWDPPLTGSAPAGYVLNASGVGSVATARRFVSGTLPPGSYTVQVRSTGPCGTSAPATQVLVVP